MATVTRQVLQGRWMHSHEEDTPHEIVFRPASFRFPPSRGRASFELKPDGTLIERAPGPTDRAQETHGQWDLEGGHRLAFRKAPGGDPHRVLEVVSADAERLVVKR